MSLFHLFKDDQCQFESSQNYSLSYINMTECKGKLIQSNPSLSSEEILFIKVDINRTSSQTNKAMFNAYALRTGNKLDISICGSIVIGYPISNKIRITQAEKMLSKGIDVFNSSDPFFTDFCYPYFDEDGKDVLISDRREDYFQQGAFCEEGCEYLKVNFKTAMAECSCNAEDEGIMGASSVLDNIPLEWI